jgi:hypothetical protein
MPAPETLALFSLAALALIVVPGPAVLDRDVRAERADVHVLVPVGGEADRVLPHQERALADRAGPRGR